MKKDDEALSEVARGMAEGTTLWLPCPISPDFKPQKTESTYYFADAACSFGMGAQATGERLCPVFCPVMVG